MKKLMKALSGALVLSALFMGITGCADENPGSERDPHEEVTVQPEELLKKLPVTAEDLAGMLESGRASRAIAPEAEINLDAQESISARVNERTSDSEIILLVLKHCISEVEGFEFGKNKTIGVIGEFSEAAKAEFLKLYSLDYVSYLFESLATRDFGTVRIDMTGTTAEIYWYTPGWSPSEGMTFPATYLYLTGTFKNDKYENITSYGDGYCYIYDENHVFDRSVPGYEKKYVSGGKVVSQSIVLKDAARPASADNSVYRIEVASENYTAYGSPSGIDTDVVYKEGSYSVQGCATEDGYRCYVLDSEGNLVLNQVRSGDSYTSLIPLTYLSLPEGMSLWRYSASEYRVSDGENETSVTIVTPDPYNVLMYSYTASASTDYVASDSHFTFSTASECTALIATFAQLLEKGQNADSYAADLPAASDLTAYQNKIDGWKTSLK